MSPPRYAYAVTYLYVGGETVHNPHPHTANMSGVGWRLVAVVPVQSHLWHYWERELPAPIAADRAVREPRTATG